MVAMELMVGDWVYAIDANGEKHPCRANNLEYDYTNKRGDFCVDFYGTGYEAEWPDVSFNVEPIPLTQEILEKNGWKHDPSVQRAMINTNFQRNNYLAMAWDSKSHVLNMSVRRDCDINIPCEYVHILQHALRLCGIKKEIVL